MRETVGTLTVSRLNAYVGELLSCDPILRELSVEGELSGFHKHSSGHLYFTVKDASAAVRCVMFRREALSLRFAPLDGMRVVLDCSASLYARDGSFQLYVRRMEKQGAGALFARFIALKEALAAEGLFDPAKKRPIPFLPGRVGVITSGTGAALQDIQNVIRRRFPQMDIVVCPVQVQGAEAAGQIARALRLMNQRRAADVLIVGRGGGSAEDLWAFNEELVARAIAQSDIPVISAVGHETDFTIADFAADLRAPTPSAAAELAVPDYAACRAQLAHDRVRLARSLPQFLARRRDALRLLACALATERPRRAVFEARQTLDELQGRLLRALSASLDAARTRLSARGARLGALDPRAVLTRGYAILTNAAGQSLRSASDAAKGDLVYARLADGRIAARVEEVEKSGERERDGSWL